ncbi:activity-regulated cytoskeleton associated protein 2-like [Lucilia sericata]|uniref:activity-regulated cytoskeleton associated protein 2-like n=1 Tax=Lucilia sericata TaxID=13632 RepID=UPI0018A882AF|nr:activity-regulated cytoskeleton associated protein 2-like [Lucilia sericata]
MDTEELNVITDFNFDPKTQILAAVGGTSRGGSFTQCTARYKGQRDPAAVEKFLAAISVYKDIEKISDADAIRGMPLLFEDYAATWWIGVKDTVTSFEDAKALIRATFSPPIPDWRIFSNIFELKQQKREPTDSFICKKRLLLSQLKVPVSEEVQLNMIYGLLNITIRERVRRENIRTFSELISASREAEMFVTESCPATSNMDIKQENVSNNRCGFCRLKGHSIEHCFKRKKRDEQQGRQQIDEQQQLEQQKPITQQRQVVDLLHTSLDVRAEVTLANGSSTTG